MKTKSLLGTVLGVLIIGVTATLLTGSDHATEEREIVEVLQLGPGDIVADIGAGDGEWSVRLARIVEPQGHVFATEVEKSKIRKIRKEVKRSGLGNITPVLGTADSTGLEDECCDAVLLRVVFHHFSEPAAMSRQLFEILKPGGRIAIIEFPPRNGGKHGIRAEAVIDRMEEAGFSLLQQMDRWQEHTRYLLLFAKSEADTADATGATDH